MKHLTKAERTQQNILLELARVYKETKRLYKMWETAANYLWNNIEPDLRAVWDEKPEKVDLKHQVAWKLPVRQSVKAQEVLLNEFYQNAVELMVKSLIETYKVSSRDAYKILGIRPLWVRKDLSAGQIQGSLERIADRNIKDNKVSKPWCQDNKVYSTRLMEYIINYESRIVGIIYEGMEKGWTLNRVHKEIWRLAQAKAYDFARLMKTETMAFYNMGLKDTYIEAGVEFVQIVGDAVCGGICLDYVDGGEILLADAELNDDLPPYHPNCACSFEPIWEYMPLEEALEYDELENLDIDLSSLQTEVIFKKTGQRSLISSQ